MAHTSDSLRNVHAAIESIRANGFGESIELPTVIVCGDQSAGKSSLLESLFGVSFPTKGVLCTRFPHELALKRSSTPSFRALLRPGGLVKKSEAYCKHLSEFVSSCENLAGIGKLVEEATDWLGINGKDVCFSDDKLHIEFCGPQMQDITLVDLPGFFHTPGPGQNEEDIVFVQNLARHHMAGERAIILALVSGKSDPPLQVVTKFAKEADPLGQRTIGVVTKPDTIDSRDLLAAFLNLLRNEEESSKYFLKHGWFAVKNKTKKHEQLGVASAVPEIDESTFFNIGEWNEVAEQFKGVGGLRKQVDAVIRLHIVQYAPCILEELRQETEKAEKALSQTKSDTNSRGVSIPQLLEHMRSITNQATKSEYNHPFFHCDNSEAMKQRKLATCIEDLLVCFRQTMRKQGHTYCLDSPSPPAPTSVDQHDLPKPSISSRIQAMEYLTNQLKASDNSGEFPHPLASRVFYMKASRWAPITQDLFHQIERTVQQFLVQLVQYVCPNDETIQVVGQHIIQPLLNQIHNGVFQYHTEVTEWLSKEEIIFFNPTLTRCRLSEFSEELRRAAMEVLPRYAQQPAAMNFLSQIGPNTNNSFDFSGVADALTESFDLHRATASGILRCVEEYYENRLGEFLPKLSIHNLGSPLMDPMVEFFHAGRQDSLPNECLDQLSGTTQEMKDERTRLEQRRALLHNEHRRLSTAWQVYIATAEPQGPSDNAELRNVSRARVSKGKISSRETSNGEASRKRKDRNEASSSGVSPDWDRAPKRTVLPWTKQD